MPQRLMDYAAVFLIALPLTVLGGANPGDLRNLPTGL